MTNDAKRFQQLEKLLTAVLCAALFLFIVYLIAAGSGVIWLKVLSAIFVLFISILVLTYLKITNLLSRARTLWISTAACCLIICVLFSLILNFPSKL